MQEIENFDCVRCNKPIKHADLDQAIVKLSRNREGIVMICGECNKSSYKRPMVVSIETRIK